MSMLPSGLPAHVENAEDLSRFLTSSNDFVESKGIVKPRVFLPNPKNLETSVFRQGSQPVERLWKIANAEIPPERTVYGAGIVKAETVRKADLEVMADENPPNGPRHANIVGWPELPNDPEDQKNIWKDRANVIASDALLILR